MWLREQLASGPVPTSQLMTDAKENGFAERTLRRAFKEIGGRSKKGGDGQWSWALPGEAGQQDGHDPP